jgi:hypothetical protein
VRPLSPPFAAAAGCGVLRWKQDIFLSFPSVECGGARSKRGDDKPEVADAGANWGEDAIVARPSCTSWPPIKPHVRRRRLCLPKPAGRPTSRHSASQNPPTARPPHSSPSGSQQHCFGSTRCCHPRVHPRGNILIPFLPWSSFFRSTPILSRDNETLGKHEGRWQDHAGPVQGVFAGGGACRGRVHGREMLLWSTRSDGLQLTCKASLGSFHNEQSGVITYIILSSSQVTIITYLIFSFSHNMRRSCFMQCR